MRAEWTLPWPTVTTNHAYAGIGNGRLRKTDKATSWQMHIVVLTRGSRMHPIPGQRLCLTAWQYPPKGWHGDADGFWKLLKDAVCRGVGINDYWVVEEHNYRGPTSDDPHIDVTLEEARWRSLDEVRNA